MQFQLGSRIEPPGTGPLSQLLQSGRRSCPSVPSDTSVHKNGEKIEDDPRKPKYIQTIRGFGYKFSSPHSIKTKSRQL